VGVFVVLVVVVGVKGRKWMPEEDEFIQKNIHSMSFIEMAETLGRTREAVAQRAYTKLGLARYGHRRVWTEGEIAFIKENFGKMSYRQMEAKLGRSRTSIGKKANELGLRYRRQLRVRKSLSAVRTDIEGYRLGLFCLLYQRAKKLVDEGKLRFDMQGDLLSNLLHAWNEAVRAGTWDPDAEIAAILSRQVAS